MVAKRSPEARTLSGVNGCAPATQTWQPVTPTSQPAFKPGRVDPSEEPIQEPTPGVSPRVASTGYQNASDGSHPDANQPGASNDPQTASERCRAEGSEAGGSAGYQSGSDGPSTLSGSPGSGSADPEGQEDDDERMDPYEAFAQSAAKAAAERKREKERGDPAIWLPGSDELDQEPLSPDVETGFSRDRWRRGNPQVSVRPRPLDFDRLRRAAQFYGVRPTTFARMMVIRGVNAILEAELRKRGNELRGTDFD